jgi:hypothetical protein
LRRPSASSRTTASDSPAATTGGCARGHRGGGRSGPDRPARPAQASLPAATSLWIPEPEDRHRGKAAPQKGFRTLNLASGIYADRSAAVVGDDPKPTRLSRMAGKRRYLSVNSQTRPTQCSSLARAAATAPSHHYGVTNPGKPQSSRKAQLRTAGSRDKARLPPRRLSSGNTTRSPGSTANQRSPRWGRSHAGGQDAVTPVGRTRSRRWGGCGHAGGGRGHAGGEDAVTPGEGAVTPVARTRSYPWGRPGPRPLLARPAQARPEGAYWLASMSLATRRLRCRPDRRRLSRWWSSTGRAIS